MSAGLGSSVFKPIGTWSNHRNRTVFVLCAFWNEQHSRDTWVSQWSSKHLVTGSIEIQLRPIDPCKKGKVFPVHAMKAHMKEKMYNSTHSYFGTRWKRVVNFTPRFLCPRKELLRCPFNRKLIRLQNRSGRSEQEETILPLLAFEPRFVKLVTVTITRFPLSVILLLLKFSIQQRLTRRCVVVSVYASYLEGYDFEPQKKTELWFSMFYMNGIADYIRQLTTVSFHIFRMHYSYIVRPLTIITYAANKTSRINKGCTTRCKTWSYTSSSEKSRDEY